ncbi:MAG: polysaccharide biosynthesis/export family protein [Planctomycetota bacterium]
MLDKGQWKPRFVVLATMGLALLSGCDEKGLLLGHFHRHTSQLIVAAEPVELSAMDIARPEHMVQTGDRLEIVFPFNPELSRVALVGDDGMFTMPLVGNIQAVGLTTEQIQSELRTRYNELEYDARDSANGKQPRDYRIQAGDRLDIGFDYEKDYDDSVTVLPDGKISLKLIKSVQAEGKTPEELQKELTEKYAKYLKRPDLVVIVRVPTTDVFYVADSPFRPGLRNIDGLTVILAGTAPRQVYVAGEVKTPGVVPYQPTMTVMQAITAAGGTPRTARMSRVLLLRKVGSDEPVTMELNLKTDMKGWTTNDVALRPNDTIVVPKTPIAKLNDIMQQYVYDLIPMTRSIYMNLFYDLSPQNAVPLIQTNITPNN